ncbi:hypothetical protein CPB84DRAFT_1773572 [Gymnopilus junonius]|uniref:PAS domain-containing protein n=1 Tax=Gymnopilus junonius TaxID=109634 RepID=A0A9P5NRA6_GYMJU|nr:hypothetical protein CPB84DRAFT_1773572 [Gymnopilus junonius]
MDDHQRPQQQALQLHIPEFVYSSIPTLVPGGGAEVIPFANQDWFVHNGFTPTLTQYPYAEQDEQPPQHQSDAAPFDYSPNPPFPFPTHSPPPPPPTKSTPDLSIFLADPSNRALPAPSTFGLPVYSASGFDLLSVLARVANRPNPRIELGPVDLTCSFVVVDTRRYDHPIVYCSPTFCTLTGYQEQEVIGQNCRFLQAPGGLVARGEFRRHTSHEAVAHMRKSLLADKECQTTILNYKKNGDAFYNLVTIIPVPGGLMGEDSEIVYQVGFQVSLNEQPNAILQKHKDGSYAVNYGSPPLNRIVQSHSLPLSIRDRKSNALPPVVMSKDLKRILGSTSFLRSFPIPTPGPIPTTNASSAEDALVAGGNNHLLHLFLLEANPDFYHVVSLKGNFLYVAPSVRRVLGYEAEEMMGTSISDYAHPEDVVPLMRELKESSATGVASAAAAVASASSSSGGEASAAAAAALPPGPRPVDLLFRAKTKMGRYVWVSCRGRLHMEPGKGRKAIVLVGRAREMMNLKWEDVNQAGGMAKALRVHRPSEPSQSSEKKQQQQQPPPPQSEWVQVEQQAWGMLGGSDQENSTFMSVSQGMEDVLGWTSDDLLGMSVMDVVSDESARNVLAEFIYAMRTFQRHRHFLRRSSSSGSGSAVRLDDARWKKVRCKLRKKDGTSAQVWFVLYRADPDGCGDDEVSGDQSRGVGMAISPAHLVYQIRLVDAETLPCGSASAMLPLSAGSSPATSSSSLNAALTLHSSTLSATSFPQQPSPSTSSATSWPSLDIFDELAVERGSSWQYEREQLRIANMKMMDELAAYEAGGLQAGSRESEDDEEDVESPRAADEQRRRPSSPLPLQQSGSSDGYEPPSSSSFGDVLRPHVQQQQPLFSTQRLVSQQPSCPLPSLQPLVPLPQHHQLDDSLPPLSLSRPPYLHQPQPQLSLQNVTQGLHAGASSMEPAPPPLTKTTMTIASAQHQPRTVFSRLSFLPDPGRYDREWNGTAPLPLPMSSGLSQNPYAFQNYTAPGRMSSFKRPWNAIDS